MKLKIIAFITALLVIGFATALFLYNKPHKDIRSARPDYITNVETLMLEFGANQQAAFERYAGKVLLVSGQIGIIVGCLKSTLQETYCMKASLEPGTRWISAF
ncbi:MAG: hypothetical protein U5K79_15860 [Cyclobacteriaceae bacterium]|nr:hypothetical protein [Cyclobacteriaceae bacterium]